MRWGVAIVVIGGQTRGVGKTSVVCGLIEAMPERQWTAVKMSVHGHSAEVEVLEETTSGRDKDSERYLAAGAVRSFYISVPERGLWRAIPRLLDILAEAKDAIVESASVLEYLRPELALAVVDPVADDVKDSLRLMAERFDAVVAIRSADFTGALRELEAKPRFVVRPPVYGSEKLKAFVRETLMKNERAR